MNSDLFNEGEVLEKVALELGKDFALIHIDQIRSEIRRAHERIKFSGVEAYLEDYLVSSDHDAALDEHLAVLCKQSPIFIRVLDRISMLLGYQGMYGFIREPVKIQQRISHAVYKVIAMSFPQTDVV